MPSWLPQGVLLCIPETLDFPAHKAPGPKGAEERLLMGGVDGVGMYGCCGPHIVLEARVERVRGRDRRLVPLILPCSRNSGILNVILTSRLL